MKLFEVKIVTEKEEILLNNLDEMDVCEIFANAYASIYKLEPKIKFTDEVSVDALTLSHFYINK